MIRTPLFRDGAEFSRIDLDAANELLCASHYLGPIRYAFDTFAMWSADELVAVMAYANPRAKSLPQDDTWLELVRWCLTPAAGRNAGSRFFSWTRRRLQESRPDLTTLVSYSDPSAGHTGALYRACGWVWAPTWHRLRPPPSGNGSWREGFRQNVKDRWVYPVRPDDRRAEILRIKDAAVVRRMEASV